MSLFAQLVGRFRERNSSLIREVPSQKDTLPSKFYLKMSRGGWWVDSVTIDEPSSNSLKVGESILCYELKETRKLTKLTPTWEITSAATSSN